MEIIPGPSWEDLLSTLRESGGFVMLIGETDSGKSTLARHLVEFLFHGRILSLSERSFASGKVFGLPFGGDEGPWHPQVNLIVA